MGYIPFTKWFIARILRMFFGWMIDGHSEHVRFAFYRLTTHDQRKHIDMRHARGQFNTDDIYRLCTSAKNTTWHMFWFAVIWALLTTVAVMLVSIAISIPLYAKLIVIFLGFAYYALCIVRGHYELFKLERQITWDKLKTE